jgi:hypothetical protein
VNIFLYIQIFFILVPGAKIHSKICRKLNPQENQQGLKPKDLTYRDEFTRKKRYMD